MKKLVKLFGIVVFAALIGFLSVGALVSCGGQTRGGDGDRDWWYTR